MFHQGSSTETDQCVEIFSSLDLIYSMVAVVLSSIHALSVGVPFFAKGGKLDMILLADERNHPSIHIWQLQVMLPHLFSSVPSRL